MQMCVIYWSRSLSIIADKTDAVFSSLFLSMVDILNRILSDWILDHFILIFIIYSNFQMPDFLLSRKFAFIIQSLKRFFFFIHINVKWNFFWSGSFQENILVFSLEIFYSILFWRSYIVCLKLIKIDGYLPIESLDLSL